MRLVVFSILIATASQVTAYPQYTSMVPNGGNVNGGAANIGHINPQWRWRAQQLWQCVQIGGVHVDEGAVSDRLGR